MSYKDNIVISGFGIHHPPESISNEELVATFNQYVEAYNNKHSFDIEEGVLTPLRYSSADFIEKVSGIKHRYVRDKANILDPNVMWPYLPSRADSELSLQAEAAVMAGKEAIKNANKNIEDVDAVIISSSHRQRDFPSVAIEVQNELGIEGLAYHMGNACSSATFGIQAAAGAICLGTAKTVLLICPELKSGQFSYRDRDSHFIFGEATGAMIIEAKDTCCAKHAYAIQDMKFVTSFSSNIRNNRGAYNRCELDSNSAQDKLFYQKGRQVFKEVSLLVTKVLKQQLKKQSINANEIKRFWLHQANSNMNRVIVEYLLGKKYEPSLAPTVLEEFGNTSSAGVILSMYFHHQDIKPGELGIICSFGAGYSVGSIIVKKI